MESIMEPRKNPYEKIVADRVKATREIAKAASTQRAVHEIDRAAIRTNVVGGVVATILTTILVAVAHFTDSRDAAYAALGGVIYQFSILVSVTVAHVRAMKRLEDQHKDSH